MATHENTVVVTTAGMSGTEDRELRQRRYLLSQSVRVGCFVLAVTLPVPLWAKLVLIVGALLLPWLGVVAANAGPTRSKGASMSGVEPVEVLPLQALEPGRTIDQED